MSALAAEALPDIGLAIDGLDVRYRVRGIEHRVIHALSLQIGRGEIYGLVGESGSGKSTVALAIQRYLPANGRIASGTIRLAGLDLLQASRRELRALRARDLAMVYQDPGQSLNRSLTIGRQLTEAFEAAGTPGHEAYAAARAMLARVRIADPERTLRSYPQQLSGGMQQRVMIAMALAGTPSLLILDEPTTGLDAAVEAEVLALIRALRDELGFSVLFISHNIDAIRRLCDRVGVMYAGRLVEEAPTEALLRAPRHPYTAALLRCLPHAGAHRRRAPLATLSGAPPGLGENIEGCAFAPRCAFADARCRETPPLQQHGAHRSWCQHTHVPPAAASANAQVRIAPADLPHAGTAPVLRIEHISKTFAHGDTRIEALSDVSFAVYGAETLGLVGESGSGKSTLARILSGLETADAGGTLELHGEPLHARTRRRTARQRKALQMVFQDSGTAMNPAHRIGSVIARLLAGRAWPSTRSVRERVAAFAARFQLTPAHLAARPGQLSGGQRQRAAIARAFAGAPDLLICDEPTSALDASVQAAILNLLVERQSASGTSYLFISHDLDVMRYLADRIVVLYRGTVVQTGTTEQVVHGPQHPYTRALFRSHAQAIAHPVAPDAPLDASRGCRFQAQCPERIARCANETPVLHTLAHGQTIRCHHFAP